MTAIITALITSILLVFSNVTYAKNYGAKICQEPEYTCYKVKKGDSWTKLFPDDDRRDLVMRINRMNTSLYKGLTIALPASDDSDPLNYSPLPTQIDPPGEKTIIVSTSELAFGAYDSDGNLQHWGPISSGRGYCPDVGRRCRTSLGHFEIYNKRGQGCASTRYPVGRGGAPMPYCMFFNGNFALHGSYNVPGYNDSHGCVRLFINDAKWLNQEFTADEPRTRVIIQ